MKKDKSAIEERIVEFIEALKNKTPVSISNLETFYSLVWKIQLKFEELRKSRDLWRTRAENSEKKLREKKNESLNVQEASHE